LAWVIPADVWPRFFPLREMPCLNAKSSTIATSAIAVKAKIH